MRQPKILVRLKRQLRDQGIFGERAHEIAFAAMQRCGNIRADGSATKKGAYRGNKSAKWREKDRAKKYSEGRTVTHSRR